MSKALELIEKLSMLDEIGYYGQKNDYTTKGYDTDTGEYMEPFKDLQLPDKAGDGLVAQTKSMKRKSRIEDKGGNTVK